LVLCLWLYSGKSGVKRKWVLHLIIYVNKYLKLIYDINQSKAWIAEMHSMFLFKSQWAISVYHKFENYKWNTTIFPLFVRIYIINLR
jgi:hypothetical protein